MDETEEPTAATTDEKRSSENDADDQVSIASDCIGFHFPCLDWVTHSQ